MVKSAENAIEMQKTRKRSSLFIEFNIVNVEGIIGRCRWQHPYELHSKFANSVFQIAYDFAQIPGGFANLRGIICKAF